MTASAKPQTRLLSGNEALALGAYHAGVSVAAAYPGTPSTEVLESLARFPDIYAEWSTNEKVAMEVALGASYAGARALVAMKHVGLNVAADPFLAAATTGVKGGLVVVSADDPGIHSSQNEQDNRHYARLAKVPALEPSDSQEAYDLAMLAFAMSETFDTPVMLRSTTRVSHSKSVVRTAAQRVERDPAGFKHDLEKFVMLPVFAWLRRPLIEERLVRLVRHAETFPFNQVFMSSPDLGIVTSGIAYQYAREVFPGASFLKLGMTYPLPAGLIRDFASRVKRLVVIEELDPVLEEGIRALGLPVSGKEFIPRMGELNPAIIEDAARAAGLLPGNPVIKAPESPLPKRPPLLCPGCPHSALFFALNAFGQRSRASGRPKLIITGDIGCYTLGAYPPLNAMDTCACMGASIGQAIGMEKAGVAEKVVAVIGDSTFLHSGVTPLVNAVYNQSRITLVILDNSTTAMTGHQEHPGTGVTARGQPTDAVKLEDLVRGAGVSDVKVIDAFNVKEIVGGVRGALNNDRLSVIIVRGDCAVKIRDPAPAVTIDRQKCDDCGACLRLGCPAIQKNERLFIEETMCIGCGVCAQLCARRAIS
ncbi:MAG: indolepyruvate ferredoxin oxidoreductase subunit alpha [Chloroflexi bacterium]|nr:indolepyruvate ferredoxin oxidoreductase subunit alpha [Chloroflexota bacterium]